MDRREERGTGRTMQALRTAPRGAIYVWVNDHFTYPRELAKRLGRDDLRIVSPDFFLQQYRGTDRPVWVDHAVRLTPAQTAGYTGYMESRRGRGTAAEA